MHGSYRKAYLNRKFSSPNPIKRETAMNQWKKIPFKDDSESQV